MSKEEIKRTLRAIRDRYKDGEAITGKDDLFIRDIFSRHPSAQRITGVGISHFVVRPDLKWGTTRAFWLVKTDGSTEVFSAFKVCLVGAKKRKEEVQPALRDAILGQCWAYKKDQFAKGSVFCPFHADEQLACDETTHVDHVPPNTFDALVNRWMKENSLTLATVCVSSSAPNTFTREMTDEGQKQSWREFHAKHASLRLCCRLGNLSDSKQEAKMAEATAQ